MGDSKTSRTQANEVESEGVVHAQTVDEPFSSYIFKVLVSGVGFFSDAYDLFVINIVLVILKEQYNMTTTDKVSVSVAALAGAVIGMCVFGVLADKIGRRKGFIATLSLVVLGALASSLAFETPHSNNLFVSLSFFRFILGIGIGGEYPLSATIAAESSSSEKKRGRLTASVFSMQGAGQLVAGIVGYLLIYYLYETHPELTWRLCFGFGCIPGIIMFYFRIVMKETEEFTKIQHEREITYTSSGITENEDLLTSTFDSYSKILKVWGWTLLGTAGSWCLFDITFYANGIFAASVLDILGIGNNSESYEKLLEISKFNIYIALMALPGYWCAIFVVEWIGTKKLQIFGFFAIGVLYFFIGIFFDSLKDVRWLVVSLYGMTFFFSNCGPNTTTFVIPAECFPTEIRARAHGFSAASGKIGAVIGAGIMPLLLTYSGLSSVMIVSGCISFAGLLLTWWLVKETKDVRFETLTNGVDFEL